MIHDAVIHDAMTQAAMTQAAMTQAAMTQAAMTHKVRSRLCVARPDASLPCCILMVLSVLGCQQRRTEAARKGQTGAEEIADAPDVRSLPGRTATSTTPATNGATTAGSVVAVPTGTVTKQGRRITIPAFYIDRTEVTVRAYEACVAANHCKATPSTGDCNAGQPQQRASYPINCVTELQAASFCAARGARLPTEGEWQLAAAGPEGRSYPWGSALPSLLWVTQPKNGIYAPGPARHNLCWQGDGTTDETYPKSTCPVGSYHAGDTPSGISDLAGNVWEWTSSARTQAGGDPLYTLKGGGFGYDRMGPLEVRTTDSREYEADFFGPDIGFRCVQDRGTAQN